MAVVTDDLGEVSLAVSPHRSCTCYLRMFVPSYEVLRDGLIVFSCLLPENIFSLAPASFSLLGFPNLPDSALLTDN